MQHVLQSWFSKTRRTKGTPISKNCLPQIRATPKQHLVPLVQPSLWLPRWPNICTAASQLTRLRTVTHSRRANACVVSEVRDE